MIFELAQDIHDAVEAMPREHPKHRMLELLEQAIQREVHFIARHPTTLFQCMWNTCWWYDCDEAVKHYEEPTGRWKEPPLWEVQPPLISPLLESWKAQKGDMTPFFLWLRSLRPPKAPLGNELRQVLRGHENEVTSVRYSAEGKYVATGCSDGRLRIWETGSGRLRHILGLPGAVCCVALSRDGRYIAGGDDRGNLRIWDMGTTENVLSVSNDDEFHWFTCMDFSPEGKHIAAGSDFGHIGIWDVATGERVLAFQGPAANMHGLAFAPNRWHIATVHQDATARLWDATSGREVLCLDHDSQMEGYPDIVMRVAYITGGDYLHKVTGVAFSPDGKNLVTASGRMLNIWDVGRGQLLRRFQGHEELIEDVVWSPDSQYIASVSWDTTAKVWDPSNGELCGQFRGHGDVVFSACFSPDSQFLATASGDKTACIWRMGASTDRRRLKADRRFIRDFAFSSDGRKLAAGSDDGRVGVWDVEAGTELHCHKAHDGGVYGVRFSRNGRRIVSWGDTTVKVWEPDTGRQLACRAGDRGLISQAACSADARRIVAIDHGRALGWDGETGDKIREFGGLEDETAGKIVACSDDGTKVVCASRDGTVQAWDWDSGQQLWRIRVHEYDSWNVACSLGDLIVSRSKEGVCLINPSCGTEVAFFRWAEDGLSRCAISAELRDWVATCWGEQGRLFLDGHTGELLLLHRGDPDMIARAACDLRYRFRIVSSGFETRVEDLRTSNEVAWFPITFSELRANPTCVAWAGEQTSSGAWEGESTTSHLSFLVLEGRTDQNI